MASSSQVFHSSELPADIPPAVREYFTAILRDGTRMIRCAEIDQNGQFLMPGRAKYTPFTATEGFTVDPPSFHWDASMGFLPLMPVKVHDRFEHGHGAVDARIWRLFTLAHSVGPTIDRGAFVRFASECCWLPTALLPGKHAKWTESAKGKDHASLQVSYGDFICDFECMFDPEHHFLTQMSTMRDRDYGDGKSDVAEWIVSLSEYKEFDGIRIPTHGEVSWKDDVNGLQTYYIGDTTNVVFTFEV